MYKKERSPPPNIKGLGTKEGALICKHLGVLKGLLRYFGTT